MAELPPLHEKHAVVTGGGRGIGLAVAQELVRLGAHLTLLGRTKSRLEGAANRLDGDVQVLVCDVADEGSVDLAFEALRQGFGGVDILVNNAGQATTAPFERTSLGQFRQMVDVNLTGTFLCSRAVVGDMKAAGWGRIVNVASTAGMVGYPYVSAYVAAKHGVIGLTRAMALELARKSITVNAVCPGFTETDMVAASVKKIVDVTGRSAEEARAELTKHNPQGRLIQPQEVAEAVGWLCLPGSASVTGQSVAVAGGEVM